jgi:ankyrin repeat protein
LHNAALSGNLEMVKWLVEKGLNVNTKNKDDWYVIHSAARSGNLELVKWLNEHGANIFVKSNYDSTLLHVAAEKGHLQLVKWLVEEKGLDVNAPNGSDQTPMMLAALEDKYDVRDWLKAKGGVPTVRNEKFHEEFNKEWQEHLQQRKEQWWKLP